MKKVLISIIFIFIANLTNAQSIFNAFKTEVYYKSLKQTDEWVLTRQNEDANITIVNTEDVLSIQAKTPTMYRLDASKKTEHETKEIYIFRYPAYEYNKLLSCTIDFVISKDVFLSDIFIISIIGKTDTGVRYNLRYYCTKLN